MLPSKSTDYPGDHIRPDTVSSSQFALFAPLWITMGKVNGCCVFGSDFPNNIVRQFSSWNFGSMRRSTLGMAVSVIISACPQPQMSRVAASWVVSFRTVVENALISGDATKCQLPCNARRYRASVFGPESSIPGSIPMRFPFPAIIGSSFLDLFPKTLRDWPSWFWKLFGAFPAAAVRFVNLRWKFLELFAANRTLVGVHLKAFFLGVQRLVARTINLAFCTPKAA